MCSFIKLHKLFQILFVTRERGWDRVKRQKIGEGEKEKRNRRRERERERERDKEETETEKKERV